MATDEDLLRALHDEHGDALFAHALRLCDGDRQRAEDLVQETLLRAWRHPEALDPERGSTRAWLFTTARRLAIDAWRRRGVEIQFPETRSYVKKVLDAEEVYADAYAEELSGA